MMLEPITRKETFLSAAAGETMNIPEPQNREEYFLKAIAENSGGGGGGGGDIVVKVVDETLFIKK